jgi:glutaredoxin
MSIKLTLYTRTGCHLCEDMERALPELASELNFNTEIVLIDNNNELEQAWGTKVPVLAIGDNIICEYFLDKVALSEAITRYQ